MSLKFKKDINPGNKFYLGIGYFALINEGEDLVLYDEMGNSYGMDKVTLLTEYFSSDNADIGIPDPFVIGKNNEVLENGSKLLLLSPFSKQNIIVLGALNPAGQQDTVRKEIRLSKNNLQKKVQKRTAGKTLYNVTFDEGGIIHSLTNGSFSIDSDTSVSMIANMVSRIEGKEIIELFGSSVEVGGNDKQREDVQDYKADEINLLGKKVVVGHSDNRIQVIPVDQINQEALDNPILQQMVLGNALAQLFDVFMDEYFNAIYLGAGSPVRLSETSKTKMRLKVKQKIPQILSNVGFILAKPEQVKGRQ